ncbi:hypothetical protein OROGR_008664 [Orobanche gracilis]
MVPFYTPKEGIDIVIQYSRLTGKGGLEERGAEIRVDRRRELTGEKKEKKSGGE